MFYLFHKSIHKNLYPFQKASYVLCLMLYFLSSFILKNCSLRCDTFKWWVSLYFSAKTTDDIIKKNINNLLLFKLVFCCCCCCCACSPLYITIVWLDVSGFISTPSLIILSDTIFDFEMQNKRNGRKIWKSLILIHHKLNYTKVFPWNSASY